MTTISAYLVNVEQRTIRSVAIDRMDSLKEIRRHIGCSRIDMVRIDRDHCVVVDDDGLTDELPCFTELTGYRSPLAGNLLIVGTNAAGETVAPQRPIEDFAEMLRIRYPVLSPVFETIRGPNVFGSRVSGFSVELKDMTPVILPEAHGH
ncbi:DUF3846 domain-containing protein [Rhodopseudomonas parapalustris]